MEVTNELRTCFKNCKILYVHIIMITPVSIWLFSQYIMEKQEYILHRLVIVI